MKQLAERICAVVVTYNRKELLRVCLDAVLSQTRAVDAVLVIDNASADGTAAMVAAEYPAAELLALPENIGGAGGFHEGVRAAYADGRQFDWVWLMDDDGIPARDCLEKLLAHRRPFSALVPVQQEETGKAHGISIWNGRVDQDQAAEIAERGQPVAGDYIFTFVGPLIARSVIEKIGLPAKEFFIFFDDSDYALRIREAGGTIVVVPAAVMSHPHGKPRPVRFLWHARDRNLSVPWKCYYSTRNSLYLLMRGRHKLDVLANYFFAQLKHLLGDMMYEPLRWQCLRMHLKAMWDGARGNLGKRVAPH